VSPERDAAPRRPGGFVLGVRCGLRGIARCVATPALWPWALVPAVLTFVLFVVPTWMAHGWATDWARDLAVRHLGEGWGGAASVVTGFLVFVLTLLVAYLAFAPLARVVAAPFLALLSDRTVARLAGAAPPSFGGGPFVRFVVVPVRDALVFLAVRVVVTVLLLPLLCVPVVGGVLLFLALMPLEGLDRMDVAQSSRGVPLGRRLSFIRRRFGACCGLGLVAAGLLLVPLVNVLLLPGLVVGAVLLDAEVSDDFPRAAGSA
jgi:CysZ protein